MVQKVNYLSNRELLGEIHRCKKSFCYYLEEWHADQKAIVRSVAEITPELIDEVRAKVARPRGGLKVDPSTIDPETIVVRVMTWEHIPIDPAQAKPRRRTIEPYVPTGFPPFKHFVLTKDGPKEVLRSHWEGGFDNGHFAMRGKMTNRLAKMFLLLVERYGRRPNFRGYSYVEEMKSEALVNLCQVGLQFDESKSDNPFAYYTTSMRNSFVRYLNKEKKVQMIRDDLLELAGANPSATRQNANRL